uniref:cytochrome P450 1A1-like n=1 Tax=Ciona intestinalis TaxID=7719 RepID=UPI000180B510|nr:cytochrome P450 1A1-like [Ciona intestinalis]|eukprot:XP_026696068.1 cytochrome P450 1A1-like [Ciona intestinalis]
MNCEEHSILGNLSTQLCKPHVVVGFSIFIFACSLRVMLQRNMRSTKGNNTRLMTFWELPYPRGLPIIGNIHQMGNFPHVKLTEWSKQFGDFYRIKMGRYDALVVNGHENIRNCLAKKSAAFAGRPPFETSKLIEEGLSISFSNYSPEWERQKQCTIKALKLYTSGSDKRSTMEETVSSHAKQLAEDLINSADQQGLVGDLHDTVIYSTTSVSSTICFGRSFTRQDPELKEFLRNFQSFDKAMGASQIINFWPFLKYFPVLGKSFRNLKTYMDQYWNFTLSMLEQHWDTYVPNNMRDLADCLWAQSNQVNSNGTAPRHTANGATDELKPRHAMNGANGNGMTHHNTNGDVTHSNGINGEPPTKINRQLTDQQRRIAYGASDAFGAGFDTISAMITWSIFYMAVFPEHQRKIREEIDRLETSMFSLRHHGDVCPYTQAWLYEVLRHISVSPLLVPHYTVKQVEVNGTMIPAGVVVLFNVANADRDTRVWENPEQFEPERFLARDPTTGGARVVASETSKILNWGAGKRRCPGAELSRHELFIYIANLVKLCYIEQAVEGIEPAIPWPCTPGISTKPKAFRVKVTQR